MNFIRLDGDKLIQTVGAPGTRFMFVGPDGEYVPGTPEQRVVAVGSESIPPSLTQPNTIFRVQLGTINGTTLTFASRFGLFKYPTPNTAIARSRLMDREYSQNKVIRDLGDSKPGDTWWLCALYRIYDGPDPMSVDELYYDAPSLEDKVYFMNFCPLDYYNAAVFTLNPEPLHILQAANIVNDAGMRAAAFYIRGPTPICLLFAENPVSHYHLVNTDPDEEDALISFVPELELENELEPEEDEPEPEEDPMPLTPKLPWYNSVHVVVGSLAFSGFLLLLFLLTG